MAGELYDLIYGDDPDKLAKAKALAAALSRQQMAGSMLQVASGHPDQAAQGMNQSAMEQMKELAQAGPTQQKIQLERRSRDQKDTEMMNEKAYREGMLGIQQGQLGLHRRQLGQSAWVKDIDPKTGATIMYNTETREKVPIFEGIDPTAAKKASMQSKAFGASYLGPDLELGPEVTQAINEGHADSSKGPLGEAIKEVGKFHRSASALEDVYERLKPIFAKYPNGVPAGQAASIAQSIQHEMQALIMPTQNMKSLREFDLPRLESIFSDPTKLPTILTSATGLRDLQAQYDTGVKVAKQRVLSEGSAFDIHPRGFGEGKVKGRYAGFGDVRANAATGQTSNPTAPHSLADKVENVANAVTRTPAMVRVRAKSGPHRGQEASMPADQAKRVLQSPDYEEVR